MLRMDTWEQDDAPQSATRVATRPTHYFRHAGQSAASLARLICDHSIDYRCTDHITVWAREVRGFGPDLVTEDAYEVLGWTSAAILRTSLARRLDTLNPVAAFRLLDQPEIGSLELSRADYVVLRSRYGYGNEWPSELSGAISGLDLDLWIGAGPAELDGAVAIGFETYLRRFAGTEIAD